MEAKIMRVVQQGEAFAVQSQKSETGQVKKCSILLQELTEGLTGEASLYLQSVSQSGDSTQLRFGYQLAGTPIRFSDGGSAAEITLSGTSITRLTLRFRQHSTTNEQSLLLPLRQTLAIAADHPGVELSVGYADGGGDTCGHTQPEGAGKHPDNQAGGPGTGHI